MEAGMVMPMHFLDSFRERYKLTNCILIVLLYIIVLNVMFNFNWYVHYCYIFFKGLKVWASEQTLSFNNAFVKYNCILFLQHSL